MVMTILPASALVATISALDKAIRKRQTGGSDQPQAAAMGTQAMRELAAPSSIHFPPPAARVWRPPACSIIQAQAERRQSGSRAALRRMISRLAVQKEA